jgi:hypothetical protein
MRVECTTGYTTATRDMEAIPFRGDILHIAEFIFIVAQVEWRRDGVINYPCLWLLPLVEADPRLTKNPYQLARFLNPPREGDVITVDDIRARVICVEWFVNQTSKRDYILHHLVELSEEDPGIAQVLLDAEEHSRRYTKTGTNPS